MVLGLIQPVVLHTQMEKMVKMLLFLELTFLVLGHGLIQKINDTTTYAEKTYSPNFTVDNKYFV